MAKRANALATPPTPEIPPTPTKNNDVPLIEPEIIIIKESTHEYEQQVKHTYHEHESLIREEADEWATLQSLHQEYGLESYHYFTDRIKALEEIATQGADYWWQSYHIDPPLLPLLATYNLNTKDFSSCYGNQLQHTLHTECLALLNRTTTLPTQDHVPALIEFIDAANTYNQEGLTHNSTKLLDFCWTLVDCAMTIVEGACDGAIGAVSQLANHPIETLITVATRGTVLNFQLCKIIYDLADLQATMLLDQDAGNKKFDDYFAPLTTIIMAIQDKKFIARDGLKLTSTIIVGAIAQAKMLNGLESFYSGLKDKAIAYIRNNPFATPAQYTITPEGLVNKSVADQSNPSNTPPKTKKLSRAEQAKEFNALPKVIGPVPEGQPTLGKLSPEVFEKAYKWLTTDNSIEHIFKEKHNFGPLLTIMGDEKNMLKGILLATENKLPMHNCTFKQIPIELHGFTIYVQGRIIDGIPRLSTMFIK